MNRQRRPVSFRRYQPRLTLQDGLLPVARDDGSLERELSNSFAGLSQNLGKQADRLAIDEGKRAGREAAANADLTGEGDGSRFRPRNSFTLRGRGFNQAGETLYRQRLNAVLVEDVQKIEDEFGDDPAVLQERLDDLYKAHNDADNGHVFDEIRPEYDLAFQKLSTAAIRRSGKKRRAAIESELRDESYRNRQTLTESLQRKLVTLDALDDASVEEIRATEGALIDEIRSARSNGVLSDHAASQQEQKVRSTTAQTFYVVQAQDFSPEEIADYRDQLREDFASGGLEGLDAAGFERVDRQLATVERQKEVATRRTQKEHLQQANKIARSVIEGFDFDPNDLTVLQVDAESDSETRDISRLALKQIEIAETIRDEPLASAKRTIVELRNGLSPGASEEDRALVSFAENALTSKETLLNRNPFNFAVNRGVIDAVDPLFTQDLGDSSIEDRLARRVSQARTISETFDIPQRFLLPGEAQGFRQFLDDPHQAAGFASAIIEAAGPDAPRFLAEVSKDAKELFQAGALLAAGGDPAAAAAVIAGYRKNADGKVRKQVPKAQRLQRVDAIVGDALPQTSPDLLRIEQTAHAIARGRIDDQGIDLKSDEADEIYDEALQEAAGAVFDRGVQYGGFGKSRSGFLFGTRGRKVLVPNDIRTDRFPDLYEALTIEDLLKLDNPPETISGGNYTQRDLDHAELVTVPGGFWLALGNPDSNAPRFIRGRDGQPFMLDFLALRDVLEPRVPGAYR